MLPSVLLLTITLSVKFLFASPAVMITVPEDTFASSSPFFMKNSTTPPSDISVILSEPNVQFSPLTVAQSVAVVYAVIVPISALAFASTRQRSPLRPLTAESFPAILRAPSSAETFLNVVTLFTVPSKVYRLRSDATVPLRFLMLAHLPLRSRLAFELILMSVGEPKFTFSMRIFFEPFIVSVAMFAPFDLLYRSIFWNSNS